MTIGCSPPGTACRLRGAARAAILAAVLIVSGVPGRSQPPAPAQPAAPQSQATPASAAQPASPQAAANAKPVEEPKAGDRRRAARLFLEASKLFEKEQFEPALEKYKQAATLDPTNPDYKMAAEIARSHAVAALIQAAVRANMRKDKAAAGAALERALQLDPQNPQVTARLRQLSSEAVRGMTEPLYNSSSNDMGDVVRIMPSAATHSFHLRTGQRQIIQQVFKGYGIEATMDDSVRGTQVRLDLDNATFQEAMRVLALLTATFYIPLDPHRVLVALDSAANRAKFEPLQLETLYLGGLSSAELTEMGTVAKSVFDVTMVSTEPSAGTITVRAPRETMAALNETLRELIDGRDQVMLDVRIIQLAHSREYNTGTQLPQTLTAFNVYAEEQQILNQNASLVQQIISSGLAAPGDTEAIIAILIASGQVTSSIFSNGLALFGGGLTLSGISPPPLSANISLNSSDSRQLDQIQMHLGDGEAGTMKLGMRYPITTSSYSSLGTSGVNIPGLNLPGSSSALGGLASQLGLGATTNPIPQVQYEDLGLTLKVTPKVLRSNDVALTIDMKIDALAGSSINGLPVLNNRAYTGVVSLPEGEGIVVVSELDKAQSRSISGVPGLSEIPGLNDITEKDTQSNYSTLLVVMTPYIVRSTQPAGHSPMMRIEANTRGSSHQ
jgi:general secretion pathway protein D